MSKTIKIKTTNIIYQAEAFSTFHNKYGKRDLTDKAKKIQEKWEKAGKKSSYGIAVLDDRFLVAMKPKYGDIGDEVTIVLNDKRKTKIKALIAETLGQDDDSSHHEIWSEWGKIRTSGKFSVVTWETTSSLTTNFLTRYKKARVKTVINESIESVEVSDVIRKTVNDSSVSGAVKGAVKSTGKLFVPSDGKISPTPADKWYHGNNNFPFNPSAPNGGGNCTWYAYGRFCEIADKWVECSKAGNAVHFYDKSYFPTCKRGKEPKLGAIICWGHTDGYEPGHVGVVEQIYKNGDIRITNSGWSGGWLGSVKLTKKSGYTHWAGTNFTWPYTFRGFIYNPVEFDSSGVAVGVSSEDETTTSIDMRTRIAQLYSSENYNFVVKKPEDEKQEEKPTTNLLKTISKKIEALKDQLDSNESFAGKISESVFKAISRQKLDIVEHNLNRNVNSIFDMSRALVEAPFILVKIGDKVIGSYGYEMDKYPNYVNKLHITKTNGEINEYNIEIVYQIRVGDDPSALDKLFSKTGFNKITITYGDAMSGKTFKDAEAIITDISMNRDYASSRITYTITATSAGNYITSHIMNFPAVTDKPSNIIRKLLYQSEIGEELRKAFPAMASEMIVNSKGLIPTNDAVIAFNMIKNIDPITYINYLVASMSNSTEVGKTLRKSSYFIFYTDDVSNGAGFEIREIKSEEVSSKYNAIYEVNVGYPDNNNVFQFNLSDNRNWSIMYNQNIDSKVNEYVYTIEDNGDIKRAYSPNLNSANQELTEYQKNWWSFMTQFPITATLTVRGLLRPAFLTNYVKINVVFYGQKHIASGLYAITEQQDDLSGGGFRTTFSLVRVGDV